LRRIRLSASRIRGFGRDDEDVGDVGYGFLFLYNTSETSRIFVLKSLQAGPEQAVDSATLKGGLRLGTSEVGVGSRVAG